MRLSSRIRHVRIISIKLVLLPLNWVFSCGERLASRNLIPLLVILEWHGGNLMLLVVGELALELHIIAIRR